MINRIPWTTSACTIVGMWMAGNKNKMGWLVGLASQVLWLWFIIDTKCWGLMPLNGFMWWLSIRNYLKWSKDDLTEYKFGPVVKKRALLNIKTYSKRHMQLGRGYKGKRPSEAFPEFMHWFFGRPQSEYFHAKFNDGSFVIERSDIAEIEFDTDEVTDE